MSRKKRKSKPEKQHKQSPSGQPEDIPKIRQIGKTVYLIISFLLALIGIFAFWPRISVFPGEALDPLRPFVTAFHIKNENYYPVFDLQDSVRIKRVKFTNNITFENISFINFSENVPKLSANTSTPIFINFHDAFNLPPTDTMIYAEIYFYISYKLPIIPINPKEVRRFKTVRKSDGGFLWNEYFTEE